MVSQELRRAEDMPLRGESIVFDLGNTLIFDPFDQLKEVVGDEAVGLARNDFGVELDKQKFLDAWSRANDETNWQFASHFSQEEPWIQVGLKEASVAEEVRILLGLQILVIYRRKFKELLEHDPRRLELRETLEQLKRRGKHLAVISNDRSFATKSMLTWIGISDLFDHVMTSEEIGIEKPDPKVFEIASKFFGKPISDIIYVGDDPVRDVDGAHKAGAKAILYMPPKAS